MQRDPNYGRPEEEREPGSSRLGGPIGDTSSATGTTRSSTSQMTAQDEKTWSIIAHLSVLAGLIGLMPFGALIVWLIYKDKSPRVRFHSLQALWYQIAWIAILIVYTMVSLLLCHVVIGIF